MQPSLDLVTLKNGARVPLVLANEILKTLQDLWRGHAITFYELVSKVRNPQHAWWTPQDVALLQELRLVERDSSIPPPIRDVVLSAVVGELLDLRLVSPFADDGV